MLGEMSNITLYRPSPDDEHKCIGLLHEPLKGSLLHAQREQFVKA
jgi:hypothetical protein